MNCKYCGAITYPTDHFCSVCGKAVIPEGNNQVNSNQYSNTAQFNNTNASPNINSFDNYNYNPSRYKPQVNANEVNKAHQVVFANSIAISLLAVMLIIFIIVALIYYGSGPMEANVVGGTNTTSQPGNNPPPGTYTPPVYPNNTTNNTTTRTNTTVTHTAKTRSDVIYTSDYTSWVYYMVPDTYTDYPDNYDQHKGYVDKAQTHMVSVMMYGQNASKVTNTLNSTGYNIENTTAYIASNELFIKVETLKGQQKCDFYLFELDDNNTFAVAVQPANLIDQEDLDHFLDITIF